MTTENQRESIESKIEAPALKDEASTEDLTQEQLESVAGGRRISIHKPRIHHLYDRHQNKR